MISEKRLIEIYRLHRNELFLYIYRMTSSRESAEDILHDCFEKLMGYAEKYSLEDTNLRSFLYKTAHNLTVNYLKKTKKLTMVELDESMPSGPGNEPGSEVELDEMNAKIYELLRESDPVTRSIFIMRKEDDMDIREIADILGITERTVRRRLSGLIENMYSVMKKSGLLNIFLIFFVKFLISVVIFFR